MKTTKDKKQQTYASKGKTERVLLRTLMKNEKFLKNIQQHYEMVCYETPEDSKKYNDAVLVRFVKDTKYFYDNIIVEAKVRTQDYEYGANPGKLLLEKKKLQNLKSEAYGWCNDPTREVHIIYISCIPDGTYIWHLSKTTKIKIDGNKKNIEWKDREIKWVEEEHNKSTMEDLGKEMKWVGYLDKKTALKIDINCYDIFRIEEQEDKDAKEAELRKKQSLRDGRVYCLFEYLMQDENENNKK